MDWDHEERANPHLCLSVYLMQMLGRTLPHANDERGSFYGTRVGGTAESSGRSQGQVREAEMEIVRTVCHWYKKGIA
jgi:hypothetical protein